MPIVFYLLIKRESRECWQISPAEYLQNIRVDRKIIMIIEITFLQNEVMLDNSSVVKGK